MEQLAIVADVVGKNGDHRSLRKEESLQQVATLLLEHELLLLQQLVANGLVISIQ